ncbi:MAG TPA: winged helix-turn-helix transcriptional regulator [Nitrososphaeraceae archaeon]|jgi:DNA-binding HxlR family transcriptional regulator|nr:winged helix-turn-helix transcriptional regulator [Nitrososphaeraceae archaeon]
MDPSEIIRDIGFLKIERFNRILESIPGLTSRVLSMRLKELEKESFIKCVEEKRSPMMVVGRLTEKDRYATYLDAIGCLRLKMVF